MRTRGADEDLVVVDLDDPDEAERRGPDARRRHFEDHYAELPFGLGTVARRIEPDPWYVRPGVLLWIAIALVGLLALAGSDDGATAPDERSFPATLPTLDASTGTRLSFLHNSSWFVVDVDRRAVASDDDPGRPPRNIRPPLQARPTQFEGLSGPLVVQEADGETVIADQGFALTTGWRLVVWRATRCGDACPVMATDMRDARTQSIVEYETGSQPIAASVAPDDDAIAIVEYNGTDPYTVRIVRPDGRPVTETTLGSGQPMLAWSRNGRWLFAAVDTTLVAIDVATGEAGRVDVTLPPYEAMFTA